LADKPVVHYTIEQNGLLAAYTASDEAEPALSIDLPSDAVSRFISRGRHGILKSAKIRGNIDLANAINDVLDNIRPDPEAFLASKVGDIAAHRAMGIFQGLKHGAEQLLVRMKDQFTEHVAEGHSVIVPNDQVIRFMSDVDALRNDAARLQQRIERLG
jgi:ubiquinone biosynthesis protein UbiJ